LVVGLDEEVDEEEKVRGQYSSSNNSCAVACIASDPRIFVRIIILDDQLRCTVVAEDQINQELNDLEGREVLFPPDRFFERGHEEIVVHENVNREVEYDWNPLHCTSSSDLSVGEPQSCRVVVPLNEFQFPLSEKEKRRIQQFVVFEDVVDVVKEL